MHTVTPIQILITTSSRPGTHELAHNDIRTPDGKKWTPMTGKHSSSLSIKNSCSRKHMTYKAYTRTKYAGLVPCTACSGNTMTYRGVGTLARWHTAALIQMVSQRRGDGCCSDCLCRCCYVVPRQAEVAGNGKRCNVIVRVCTSPLIYLVPSLTKCPEACSQPS